MFKVILHNAIKGDYEVKNSIKSWEEFTFTMSRSETYHTISKSFVSDLIFLDDGKQYIDDVYLNQGYFAEIGVSIYVFDSNLHAYDLFYKGVVNYMTQKRAEQQTAADVENGSFEQFIFNKENVSIDYLAKQTLNGEPISDVYSIEDIIRLDALGADIRIRAIKPFNLFRKLIHVLTGESDALRSNFFEFDNVYSPLSKGKYSFLTTGKYLTGKNESGGLSISFKELFENYAKIYGLGMAIEYNQINSKKWVRIDKLETFYNPEIVCDLGSVSNIEYSLNDKLLYNKINVGFPTEKVEANLYTGSEYNVEANYTNTIGVNSATLDLKTIFRADGTSMKLALTEVVEVGSEGKYDKDYFVINCVKDNNGFYVSSGISQMESVSGFVGDPLYMNLEITPAQILINNGKQINIPTVSKTGKLIFSKQQNKTKVVTQLKDSNNQIPECTDLDLSILGVAYLSPYRVKFNCSVSYEVMKKISFNPHGLYQFYDYISKRNVYGWINEISTQIVDKTTNVELQLANSKLYHKLNLMLGNNGRILQYNNGNNITFRTNGWK